MTKYIALLRGINVGGNNKIEMKKLKEVFEKSLFKNVLTYINSGNVIFESEERDEHRLRQKIEAILEENFGFKVRVVIRRANDIEKIDRAIPKDWQNDSKQKTDILFLWEEFDKKETLNLIKKVPGIDNLLYTSGAIVWNVDRKNYSKSGMNDFIGTVVYKNMTARNVNTVRKLARLMDLEV